MIPKDILKKIRKIEIKTRRDVETTFSGEYHSIFKGQGINFAEVRHYEPGDDTRLLDWNVTARTGHPHIKVFEEERELTVIIALDISASGLFGTTTQSKLELAAELAALLGYSTTENKDNIGLLLFSDRVEKYIAPKRGRAQMFQILRSIFTHREQGKKTSLRAALDYLIRIHKRRAVIMLISDFFDQGYERSLSLIAKKHDLVPLVLEDQRENKLPRAGLLALEDEETGEIIYLNSNSSKTRQEYAAQMASLKEKREAMFNKLRLDPVQLITGKPYIQALLRYFKHRSRQF